MDTTWKKIIGKSLFFCSLNTSFINRLELNGDIAKCFRRDSAEKSRKMKLNIDKELA